MGEDFIKEETTEEETSLQALGKDLVNLHIEVDNLKDNLNDAWKYLKLMLVVNIISIFVVFSDYMYFVSESTDTFTFVFLGVSTLVLLVSQIFSLICFIIRKF